MPDGAVVLLVVALVVGALGILAGARFASMHDPRRAEHGVLVARDGSFELDVPTCQGDPLCLRFELDAPTTDDDYDLLIVGEIEAKGRPPLAFATKTHEGSRIEGAESAIKNRSGIYAATTDSASIELVVQLPRGPVVVRGKVFEGDGTTLRKAWVYLPG